MSDIGYSHAGKLKRRKARKPLAEEPVAEWNPRGGFIFVNLPGRWATSFVARGTRDSSYVVLQAKGDQPAH